MPRVCQNGLCVHSIQYKLVSHLAFCPAVCEKSLWPLLDHYPCVVPSVAFLSAFFFKLTSSASLYFLLAAKLCKEWYVVQTMASFEKKPDWKKMRRIWSQTYSFRGIKFSRSWCLADKKRTIRPAKVKIMKDLHEYYVYVQYSRSWKRGLLLRLLVWSSWRNVNIISICWVQGQ